MDYAFAVKPKKQGPRMAEAFTFGMEEEYFLVDAATKVLARDVPAAFFDDAKEASDGRISTEFLQPQVEVITSPHVHMEDARVELRTLRRTVSTVAARHGLAILAAGTHPTAFWREAQQTDKQRYDTVMDDLQMIGQRDLLCGLHVHVELPDPDQRVDVMYRILPYLPLLLALSTSSPFWQARRTGLKGYRLAAYDELPRTGLPELFRTQQEFDAYVAALVRAGVIKDSSYVWWAVRPSLNNPTLELRAPDSARWSRICLPLPPSIAHWSATSTSIASATEISTRSGARSSSKTSGGRNATGCKGLSSPRTARSRSPNCSNA